MFLLNDPQPGKILSQTSSVYFQYKNRKCESDKGMQGNKQFGWIDLYTPKNILPVNLLCPMDDWFVEVVIKLPLEETQKRQLHKLNMITMSEQ